MGTSHEPGCTKAISSFSQQLCEAAAYCRKPEPFPVILGEHRPCKCWNQTGHLVSAQGPPEQYLVMLGAYMAPGIKPGLLLTSVLSPQLLGSVLFCFFLDLQRESLKYFAMLVP